MSKRRRAGIGMAAAAAAWMCTAPVLAKDVVEDPAPAVRVTATPVGDAGGAPGTLLRIRWEADPARVADWVADRRLLWFELRPERGRRRVCRHPEAPSRVDDERVLHAAAPDAAPEAATDAARACDGEEPCGPDTAHEEWVDVRAWCWGSALGVVAEPGRLQVHYGFRGRGRDRWIAKDAAGAPLARTTTGNTVALVPVPRSTEHTIRVDPSLDPGADRIAPIDVSLSPADARTADGLVFRVRVRADEEAYVYFRDDLLRFRVRGPLGERTCAAVRREVVPIRELFTRLGGRRAATTWVSASLYCPAGTFPLAGVYDVSPLVDLVYDGEDLGLDTIVGTFEGPEVPVRVRRDPGGYVEHGPFDPAGLMGAQADDGRRSAAEDGDARRELPRPQ